MIPGFLQKFSSFKNEAYALALLELVRQTQAPVKQVIRYLDSIEGAHLAVDIIIYLDDYKDKKKHLEDAIFTVIEMRAIQDEDTGETLLSKIMEVK